jgi:hypothetical protein
MGGRIVRGVVDTFQTTKEENVNPIKHKACFTDKYRKRMKKQNAGKIARRHERERTRRAEKAARIPRTLRRPSYPVWELKRTILLRRLRELLLQRIRTLASPEPTIEGTAAVDICPICSIPIGLEHYRYNVKTISYNRQPVLVHKVCPNEPGYVFLREGSPGSGRFA